MQFKTLALVAIAAVAVSAQTFDNNACTTCVFGSFDQDSSCKSLPAADLTMLKSALNPTSVNIPLLSSAVQKPEIRSCVCHWASTAFTAGGAAASCTSNQPPTCNSTQVKQASDGIKGLAPLLNCNAATSSGSSGTPSSTAAPPGASTTKSPS
ncbi:hypothetical protein BGZ65_010491, partial [Modicella reniformis]